MHLAQQKSPFVSAPPTPGPGVNIVPRTSGSQLQKKNDHRTCRMMRSAQLRSLPTRCQRCAVASAGARPAPLSGTGGSETRAAVRPGSTADHGYRHWRPRTAAGWPSPAARPADRSGSRRPLHIERDPTLLGALAQHPQPPGAHVDMCQAQPEHFARTQPAEQHKPGDRPIPPRAQAAQQPGRLGAVQRPRQRPAGAAATRSGVWAAPDAPAARGAHPPRPTAPHGPWAPGWPRSGPAPPGTRTVR